MGYEELHLPLSIIRGKYCGIILLYLGKHGTCRFSEIKTAVGDVAGKVLSGQLQHLEKQGILLRIADPAARTVSYSITEKGLLLLPALEILLEWGKKHAI